MSEEQQPPSATERARAILAGDEALPSHAELVALVASLRRAVQYERAWRLVRLAYDAARAATVPDPAATTWIVQELARCTLADEETPPARRHADALALLETIGLRTPERADPETLRLGAAVYERKWEHEGDGALLHTALALYAAAWDRDPAEDRGRGGAGAAFVLDVLAARARVDERRRGVRSDEAARLAERARGIRTEILRYAPGVAGQRDHRAFAVAAEAHFGLADYEKAGHYLRLTREVLCADDANAAPLERRDAFERLVALAAARGVALAEGEPRGSAGWRARQALGHLLGERRTAGLRAAPGRIGLALSGGGLRASFFHLGVLARLAETAVLPHVEALSTVSGGSIVGAHYHLEVRKLLRERPDDALERTDYVEIVQRVIPDFVAGAQANLRMRTLADLRANVRMICSPSQSRAHRLGELCERHLYARVTDGEEEGPRRMRDLVVRPPDAEAPFEPRFANWARRAKVPALLLHATSLDSGRAWQLTARGMGDAPGAEAGVRIRYDDAPTAELADYRLGWAVAASACIPALFEPLPVRGLPPGQTVHLVDGGARGDHAVAGLLGAGCTVVLHADGSGTVRPQPEHGPAGFCVDLGREIDGIDPDLRRALSAIRTDLDTFTEVEANALMLSGYLATVAELKRLDERHRAAGEPGRWGGFDVDAPELHTWPFLRLRELMRLPPDAADVRRQDLARQLAVGSAVSFKAWRLDSALRTVAVAAAVAVAVLLRRDRDAVRPVGGAVLAALAVAMAAMVARPARGFAGRALRAVPAFLAARLHLALLDGRYRRRGAVRRLLRLE